MNFCRVCVRLGLINFFTFYIFTLRSVYKRKCIMRTSINQRLVSPPFASSNIITFSLYLFNKDNAFSRTSCRYVLSSAFIKHTFYNRKTSSGGLSMASIENLVSLNFSIHIISFILTNNTIINHQVYFSFIVFNLSNQFMIMQTK